jgi:hypothetical protein
VLNFYKIIVLALLLTSSDMPYQKPTSCEILDEKKFESVKKFPRFRSSNIASNTIEFKEGKIYWGYSDVIKEITIECNNENVLGEIIVIGKYDSTKYEGQYSIRSKELIWEGETYQELNRGNSWN